jgi:hypothetical protein
LITPCIVIIYLLFLLISNGEGKGKGMEGKRRVEWVVGEGRAISY